MNKLSFGDYAAARDERTDEAYGLIKTLGGAASDLFQKARSGAAQWMTDVSRDANLRNLIDELVSDSKSIEKTFKQKVDRQTAQMDSLGYQVVDSMQPILAAIRDLLAKAEKKVTQAGENLISDENKQMIQSYITQFEERINVTESRVRQLAQTNFKTAFGVDEIRRGVTDLFNKIAEATKQQLKMGQEKYVAPTRAAVTTPDQPSLGRGTPKNWQKGKNPASRTGT